MDNQTETHTAGGTSGRQDVLDRLKLLGGDLDALLLASIRRSSLPQLHDLEDARTHLLAAERLLEGAGRKRRRRRKAS